MKKAKGKKGDEELLENMLEALKLDVEIMENDIHLEELKEVQAKKDYEALVKDTNGVEENIGKYREERNKTVKQKTDSLSEVEEKKATEIQEKRKEIERLEKDIQDLEMQIIKDKERHRILQAEKDEEIKAQENLFQQMTTKFQHILENTASKLQERVKMGA